MYWVTTDLWLAPGGGRVRVWAARLAAKPQADKTREQRTRGERIDNLLSSLVKGMKGPGALPVLYESVWQMLPSGARGGAC
jgi:hypothetical protein